MHHASFFPQGQTEMSLWESLSLAAPKTRTIGRPVMAEIAEFRRGAVRVPRRRVLYDILYVIVWI